MHQFNVNIRGDSQETVGREFILWSTRRIHWFVFYHFLLFINGSANLLLIGPDVESRLCSRAPKKIPIHLFLHKHSPSTSTNATQPTWETINYPICIPRPSQSSRLISLVRGEGTYLSDDTLNKQQPLKGGRSSFFPRELSLIHPEGVCLPISLGYLCGRALLSVTVCLCLVVDGKDFSQSVQCVINFVHKFMSHFWAPTTSQQQQKTQYPNLSWTNNKWNTQVRFNCQSCPLWHIPGYCCSFYGLLINSSKFFPCNSPFLDNNQIIC